jgi:hypothetical protein
MYHPQEVADGLNIRVVDDGTTLSVEHDYIPSACRQMFFESKITRVLKPLVQELKSRGALRQDWRSYLKASLMCCPLLTMNLTDTSRFPPSITLLGLCFAVEMGMNPIDIIDNIDNAGHSQSLLNHALNEADH